MIALLLSGITVFPLQSELKLLINTNVFADGSVIKQWLVKVVTALQITQKQYPFLFYGFDWLAFAHIVIAVLFIGVYQHPVRNRWIIQWAMISCVGIFPLAFIAGSIRGIPFFHMLIDCSFGIAGLIILYLIQRRINKLKKYRVSGKSSRNPDKD
jgi:hypothetical protein